MADKKGSGATPPEENTSKNPNLPDPGLEALDAKVEALGNEIVRLGNGLENEVERLSDALATEIKSRQDFEAEVRQWLLNMAASGGSSFTVIDKAPEAAENAPFEVDGRSFKLSVPAIRFKAQRITGRDLAADPDLAAQVMTAFPHLIAEA